MTFKQAGGQLRAIHSTVVAVLRTRFLPLFFNSDSDRPHDDRTFARSLYEILHDGLWMIDYD